MNRNQFTPESIFRYLSVRVPNAMATLEGSERYPQIKGMSLFYQVQDGVFVVSAVDGIPDLDSVCGRSVVGMHIHDGGLCIGDETGHFANVGEHYNPNYCPHPEHAGDLPPLFVNDGYAWNAFFTNRFAVGEVIGLPVIVHAERDDFTTQPGGGSGLKIACGIIRAT